MNRIVTDWQAQCEVLRAASCGVIETAEGRFASVHLRRWPRHASRVEALLADRLAHRWRTGNRCWLYYHQPARSPNYLVLSYVVSARGTTLATFHGALRLLDELAWLKRCDALLCDVAQMRISDRLLARWGWEPHAPRRWQRNFIKRFYGTYPASDAALAALLPQSGTAAGQLTLSR